MDGDGGQLLLCCDASKQKLLSLHTHIIHPEREKLCRCIPPTHSKGESPSELQTHDPKKADKGNGIFISVCSAQLFQSQISSHSHQRAAIPSVEMRLPLRRSNAQILRVVQVRAVLSGIILSNNTHHTCISQLWGS
jgi:hypothetical protein